ncbi:hypothetical protein BCR44DRAFT_194170 [Catenaria anguillulae PL171]|uniref:Uncharacterized protein n=1 Tax=Catenaria anguillulae PL171 TaxID=765915 RepID=A0A1Y2HP61_9FUNG|nr:hypothetical protein BCR44DRAFT_194170 [Catenaria anguillulae PL171]
MQPSIMTVPTRAKTVTVDVSRFPTALFAQMNDEQDPVLGDTEKAALSDPPPDYSADPEDDDQVVVLSLHKGHTIRFTGIDDPLAQALTSSAAHEWPEGVRESSWRGGQDGTHVPRYFKLKLQGTPFSAGLQDDALAVGARKLMCGLLRTLLEHGWKVDGVADCSVHRWGTMSSLVLMRDEPRAVGPDDMFAIAFGDMNCLCLIGVPEAAESVILRTIIECWGMGLKSTFECHGAKALHLRGRPWFGGTLVGGEPMQDFVARTMMAKVLAQLKTIGFRLYATMDLSNGDEAPSWILLRSRG